MKKLNKTQLKQRDDIGTKINDAFSDLAKAIEKYNETINAARSDVEAALTDYNAAIGEAASFRDDLVSEMDSYEGDRSEKWAETEAGEAFANWKSEWEGAELDEVEIDFPEELETPDNVQEVFDGLPEEAS